MKIILNERKLVPLMLSEIISEYNISDDNANYNPYKRAIDLSTEVIKDFIKNNGQMMQNISNGKPYLVYEIEAIANIIGQRFGICQLIKENEPYGSVLLKPMKSFKPIYY